jgi:hypothetical protein
MKIISKRIYVISKQHVGKLWSQRISEVNYLIEPGHVLRNEMDTHIDTCCTGASWAIMDLTRNVCKVTPFLDSYKPVI